MPFGWAARPLFRHTSGQLDVAANFSPLYRQEPSKLSDDELLKMLQDFRKYLFSSLASVITDLLYFRPEKLNRLTTIPATIKINITFITEQPESESLFNLLFIVNFKIVVDEL
jgi:dedicator of cytokinesis protein 9/10/11